MRKTAVLLLVSAMALSLLVILPGAQATPGTVQCATLKIEASGIDATTCPYTPSASDTQTGYVVAVTPGATWEIYYTYVNALGQPVKAVIASQSTSGTGSTPCIDTVTGSSSRWLCAKSIDPKSYGIHPIYAKIYSGSGLIELGPAARTA